MPGAHARDANYTLILRFRAGDTGTSPPTTLSYAADMTCHTSDMIFFVGARYAAALHIPRRRQLDDDAS